MPRRLPWVGAPPGVAMAPLSIISQRYLMASSGPLYITLALPRFSSTPLVATTTALVISLTVRAILYSSTTLAQSAGRSSGSWCTQPVWSAMSVSRKSVNRVISEGSADWVTWYSMIAAFGPSLCVVQCSQISPSRVQRSPSV